MTLAHSSFERTEPASVVPAAAHPKGTQREHPRQDQRKGILIICLTSMIFAVQDAVGRHLATEYPSILVVMLRYWLFAAFAIYLASRTPGTLRAALRTRHLGRQILRGVLLATNVLVMLMAFVRMGIVETHAVFAVSPLLIVALSGPVLGEKVGWQRKLAIAVGFIGILIILQPGVRVFSPWAFLPLFGALVAALYALLTRQLSADDGAMVNFFWAGVVGAGAATLVGIWYIRPIAPEYWPWLAAMCVSGAVGHYLLIRAYEIAEASSLQPFAYTQLVWVSLIGVLALGEIVRPNVVIGTAIVVGAGIFTWWRALRKARLTQA